MSLKSLAPRMRQIPARRKRHSLGAQHRRLQDRLPDRATDADGAVRGAARAHPPLQGARHRPSALKRRQGRRGRRSSGGGARRAARDRRGRTHGGGKGRRRHRQYVRRTPGSRRQGADAALTGKTVAERDLHHVLAAAAAAKAEPGRTILHALPTAFRLDATKDVRDPKGMVATNLASIFISRPAMGRPRAT